MSTIKNKLTREIEKEESHLNLAYAALLMAEYLTQPFDVSIYLSLLDSVAETVEPAVTTATTNLEIIEILNQHIFQELKFIGNEENYYHPDNSFLNRVLDMRTGIPITLSAIYLEIGWRLGLSMWGVGIPRHFIVGYGSANSPIYIDVFNGGKILSEQDCMVLAEVPPGYHRPFRRRFLKPITKKAILFRILLNLKQIYINVEDWEAAYKAVDLMLIVQPNKINEMRDRGLIAYRLNRLQSAIFDIRRYLYLASDKADDLDWLEQQLEMIEDKFMRLN